MASALYLRLATLAIVVGLATASLASARSASREGKQYKVGGADGWRVPPPEIKETYYSNWASGITFYVGDSLEFAYKNDSVIKVDKAAYYHCTETAPTPADAAPRDGSKVFRLDAPGYAYFASADLERCRMGERLMVDVLPFGQPAAPGPWTPAPGPSTGAAGRSVAASSVRAVVLALPVAFAPAAHLL